MLMSPHPLLPGYKDIKSTKWAERNKEQPKVLCKLRAGQFQGTQATPHSTQRYQSSANQAVAHWRCRQRILSRFS
jgi:hypothetical protein